MALLSEKTNMAAAKAAGISEATLWRWKHTPAFQRAYSTAGRAAYERAVASVGLLAVEAVEALREVMTDSNAPASSRVTAAKVVLDGALAGIELFEVVLLLGISVYNKPIWVRDATCSAV